MKLAGLIKYSAKEKLCDKSLQGYNRPDRPKSRKHNPYSVEINCCKYWSHDRFFKFPVATPFASYISIWQAVVVHDIFGLKKGQDLESRIPRSTTRFISNCQNVLADPSRKTCAFGGLWIRARFGLAPSEFKILTFHFPVRAKLMSNCNAPDRSITSKK